MDDRTLLRVAGEYGTPLYVYDGDAIASRYREFAQAVAGLGKRTRVFYAVKANSSLAVLALLRRDGAGADCVSGGEVETALKVGFAPKDILFTSNSKSRGELSAALKAGVSLTCDSVGELEIVSALAAEAGKTAKVSFRVNPSVDARTHPKIATGLRGSKFGVHIDGGDALRAYGRAVKARGVKVVGLHAHIGSQITDASCFAEAAGKLFEFAVKLKRELSLRLEFIDFGGGVGIKYREDDTAISPKEYAKALKPAIAAGVRSLGYEPALYFEPGRFIVGPAGVLVTRVNSVKKTPAKSFVNVDAGFNTLARPAMYDAYHRVSVLGKKGGGTVYDVAGSVCESGDILARDRRLPKVEEGDVIAIHDAGAYGMSMASEYNSRPLPAEVMLLGGKAHLVRERGETKDLFRRQKIPNGL